MKMPLVCIALALAACMGGCSGLTLSAGVGGAYYVRAGQYYRYDRRKGDYVCVDAPPWWYRGPIYGEPPPGPPNQNPGQNGDHDHNHDGDHNNNGQATGPTGNHDDHAGSTAKDRLPGPPKNEAAGFSNPFAPHDSHGPPDASHNTGESHNTSESHAGGGDSHSGGGDSHASGGGGSTGGGESHASASDDHSSSGSSARSDDSGSSGTGGGGKK